MRAALEEAGASSAGVSGHSFCIGEAKMAAEQGVEDSTIKDMGRWRNNACLPEVHLEGPGKTGRNIQILAGSSGTEHYQH